MAAVARLTVADLEEWYEGAPSTVALRSTAGTSAEIGREQAPASAPLRLCEWGAFRYVGW